jgi:tetratricopeptide (TPR) repeat protein
VVLQRGTSERTSNRSIAFSNRGHAYNKKGEYDRAIADFNEAIRLNPKFAVAFSNRGSAYNQKGEYDRAIADFTTRRSGSI